MSFHDRERARLNRRIRILPKPIARDLKNYRQHISSPTSVRKRDVAMVFVPKDNRTGFFEAADVIELCHKFLDERQVSEEYPT